MRRWVGLSVLCVLAACSSGSDHASAPSTRSSRVSTSVAAGTTPTTGAPASGPHWTTYFGDNARTGVASDGPASPSAAKQQWAATLDGDLYAQPLLLGERVIVATENDSVYSLNASDGSVVWKTHLGEPVPASALPCGNVDPVGITSTPVIDEGASRVYAAGMALPGRHMLFELDLNDGHLVDSKRIDADGADPTVHNQRGALSLLNGQVFVPYGGRFGDCGDYHGRLVAAAVTASGIGSITSYTLPTDGEGGWWAPPGATIGSDGSSLYLAAGNSSGIGTFDYGNSVVRLSPDLRLLDSFAPKDWLALNKTDGDLGTTSPVLLPDDRVFQVGKAGIGYLLDAKHLGGVGGELTSARVCSARAFGGVAHDGDTLFVPCSDGVVEAVVKGDGFQVGWTAVTANPGPTLVAGGAVWTVGTTSGDLVALDPSSGKVVFSAHVGSVPSRFTSPAAGGGRVVVGAGREVLAFA